LFASAPPVPLLSFQHVRVPYVGGEAEAQTRVEGVGEDMSTFAKRGASEPADPAGVHPVDPMLADVRFLTVAEVAVVMRVSKMTVYRLVHSADLPAVRVGRSFRVPARAVHDYLRAAFIETG
jgi:excisionase family DNA binding protein